MGELPWQVDSCCVCFDVKRLILPSLHDTILFWPAGCYSVACIAAHRCCGRHAGCGVSAMCSAAWCGVPGAHVSRIHSKPAPFSGTQLLITPHQTNTRCSGCVPYSCRSYVIRTFGDGPAITLANRQLTPKHAVHLLSEALSCTLQLFTASAWSSSVSLPDFHRSLGLGRDCLLHFQSRRKPTLDR
jgi:hypothetical protein